MCWLEHGFACATPDCGGSPRWVGRSQDDSVDGGRGSTAEERRRRRRELRRQRLAVQRRAEPPRAQRRQEQVAAERFAWDRHVATSRALEPAPPRPTRVSHPTRRTLRTRPPSDLSAAGLALVLGAVVGGGIALFRSSAHVFHGLSEEQMVARFMVDMIFGAVAGAMLPAAAVLVLWLCSLSASRDRR